MRRRLDSLALLLNIAGALLMAYSIDKPTLDGEVNGTFEWGLYLLIAGYTLQLYSAWTTKR